MSSGSTSAAEHAVEGDSGLRIRAARAGDLPVLLALASRLAEFPVPPWRTGSQVIEAERATLTRALEAASPDAPLLLAEDAAGRTLGFIYLETQADYFTARPHAHVSILAVAAAAEGRGVGRALLAAADDWARQREHPFITLNVFAHNTRARAVYERLGYGPETVRYVKPLGPDDKS